MLFGLISGLIFVPQPFFSSFAMRGSVTLRFSAAVDVCCTSFNSQLSKGKTAAEDRKCSTATPGNTHRRISECSFWYIHKVGVRQL